MNKKENMFSEGPDTDENLLEKETKTKNRKQLYKEIPLATPLSIRVRPTNRCNFRCYYCGQNLDDDLLLEKYKFNRKEDMSLQMFQKMVDDLQEFDKPVKSIIIVGHGEPLLNNDLPAMIAYAKKKNVAENIEVLTNAYALSNELSDRLIESGLDRIRISIQGINEKQYKENANVKIDFSRLIDNIKYFHSNRKATTIYIKIIDNLLKNKGDEKEFYELFTPICDIIAIEYMSKHIKDLDYRNKTVSGKSVKGLEDNIQYEICAVSFYSIDVCADGSVIPCCSFEKPIELGNITNDTLFNIWKGDKRKEFLCSLLQDRTQHNACICCDLFRSLLNKEDILDGHEKELLERLRSNQYLNASDR